MFSGGNVQEMHLQRWVQKIHHNTQDKKYQSSAYQIVGGNGKKQQTYSLDHIDQRQHADAGFVCHLTGTYVAGDSCNTEDQKCKA